MNRPILPTTYQIINDIKKGIIYADDIRESYISEKMKELWSSLLLLVQASSLSVRPREYWKKRDKERLYTTQNHIEINIENPVSIIELARLLGINDCKLKQDFKAFFGCTIFEYLQSFRMNKVR